MSHTMSRRTFSAGIASLIGGAAVLASPFSHLVAAQGADLASVDLPKLDITVTANGFEGTPTELAAGRYHLTTTLADGVEYGAAAFMRPPAGMSAEEFLAAVGLGGGGTPEAPPAGAEASPAAEGGEEIDMALPTFVYQATFAGGAVAMMPGTSGEAIIDLTPGEWILWGDDPSTPQVPVTFTVTGEMPAGVAEPEADLTMTFIDFGISLEDEVSAGDHILRIDNHGAQPHFVFVAKGPDTMTNDQIAEVLAWEMDGAQGTPPAVGFNPDTDLMPVLGTSTQSIGTTIWVPVSFELGTYAALCFFPTAGEGLPHAFHGMHTVFTVS